MNMTPGQVVVNEGPQWNLAEGVALCVAIQNLPSQKFHCHPALTGGLLYKQGPRKDCDIVIYQRGDVNGKREPIDWPGLWAALEGIGLRLIQDYGYVKKCLYQGKPKAAATTAKAKPPARLLRRLQPYEATFLAQPCLALGAQRRTPWPAVVAVVAPHIA